MARKSHAERQVASILKYGKSLYERRKESGQARGLTLSQTRGHAVTKKGEQSISQIKSLAGIPSKPSSTLKSRPVVKASKLPAEFRELPRSAVVGGSRVVTVRSEQAAYNVIREAARLDKRIVVTVYSKNHGESHILYTGARMTWNGMSASYFIDQMEANGFGVDEQLDYDYSNGSCGFLPELGDIGFYTIQFV
jgi:hypothetical protein